MLERLTKLRPHSTSCSLRPPPSHFVFSFPLSKQHKTIESVLERGEKLDNLVERSNALSAQSKMFYKTTKKQNSCCVYVLRPVILAVGLSGGSDPRLEESLVD